MYNFVYNPNSNSVHAIDEDRHIDFGLLDNLKAIVQKYPDHPIFFFGHNLIDLEDAKTIVKEYIEARPCKCSSCKQLWNNFIVVITIVEEEEYYYEIYNKNFELLETY